MDYNDKTLYQKVTEKWDDLQASYDRLEIARENVCNFFRPDLGVDYDEDADMLMLGQYIYEGTPPWAARVAATGFQANSMSKKDPWFMHQFADKRLTGIDELDEWTQGVSEHIASVYQRGNFYDIQWQFSLDAWTIGSPLSFIEEDEDTGYDMWLPQHWQTYRIFYDRYNRSEGVIIKDEQWTAKKCFDKFCPGRDFESRLEKADKIFSQSLANSCRQGRWNDRCTIWRAVFKAGDPIWNTPGFVRPVGGQRWYDVYLENLAQKVQTQQDSQLLVTGYYSKPFVHWDYNKKPWESASRTPAFEALYDALSLQQIFKNYLDSMQIAVRRPMFVLDTMVNRLRLGAEGITSVKRDEWNFTPKQVDNVGDVRLEIETAEMIKQKLERHFHLDMFRMFTDLAQAKNSKEFKVLQLTEMAGERIGQLLPTMDSHENYLAQQDERVLEIERRAGRGPFNKLDMENVLDAVMYYTRGDASASRLSPEFIGTLRQTQHMQQKLKPLQYGIGALNELAASMGDPNLVSFMIKKYDVADSTLEAVNFPQKLVNEKETYDKLQAAFEQGQIQREQFAAMVEMLKAGKVNAQQAVEPNSMMGMLQGSAA